MWPTQGFSTNSGSYRKSPGDQQIAGRPSFKPESLSFLQCTFLMFCHNSGCWRRIGRGTGPQRWVCAAAHHHCWNTGGRQVLRELKRHAAPQLRRELLQLRLIRARLRNPGRLWGPGRARVASRGLTTENYAEQAHFLATPGARLRILPSAPITPWVSFGVGLGRLNRAGSLSTPTGTGRPAVASQIGDRNVFAVSTAGGVDWKPVRFLLIRGEVRNYTFTTPQTALVGSDAFVGERRNNLIFFGGIGVRFQ